MVTAFSGRSDAADGTAFPYVLPLSPNYWTQAGLLIDYLRQQDKDLKGKKIVFVHIDTPFGREPLPILLEHTRSIGSPLRTASLIATVWPTPAPRLFFTKLL